MYDIIDHYLEAGVSKWGFSYLYSYGAPLSHKNAIGIFNGTPVPISYGPTKRFNRAMQFMANKASSDPNYRNALKQVAPIVDYYRQYFQKDTVSCAAFFISIDIGELLQFLCYSFYQYVLLFRVTVKLRGKN